MFGLLAQMKAAVKPTLMRVDWAPVPGHILDSVSREVWSAGPVRLAKRSGLQPRGGWRSRWSQGYSPGGLSASSPWA